MAQEIGRLDRVKTVIKNKRAISPVIATVILVAVAITVSVAVAYWMGGIAGMYTKFEKVEIMSAYAPKDTTTSYWNVTMLLKNTGSADATLMEVYVNNVPKASWTPNILWFNATGTPVSIGTGSLTLKSGQSVTLRVDISTACTSPTQLTSGTTINIKIHSAGGMDYIKLVELV
jgi:flagellin-like protein